MSSCGCGNTPKSDAKGDVGAVGSAMPTGGKDLLNSGSSELVECRVMPGSVIEKARAEAEGLFRDFEGNGTGSAARDVVLDSTQIRGSTPT